MQKCEVFFLKINANHVINVFYRLFVFSHTLVWFRIPMKLKLVMNELFIQIDKRDERIVLSWFNNFLMDSLICVALVTDLMN
jgi:hypothetical protein